MLHQSVFLRWLWNALMHRLNRPQSFRAYAYTIFLTYRCNFRCAYCDNGEEEKYPDVRMPELDTLQMKRLIQMIRRESDVIGFGGGEPLMRSDLEELIDYARQIGFRRIVMNTNSWQIMKRMDLPGRVDDLMISLDSMDPDYLDRLYGIRPGSAVQIIDNLYKLADLRNQKKFRLIINSVIMPDNISHLYDVMQFCIEHDVIFSPSPRLNGTYPDPELSGNDGYRQLIDTMVLLKKKGMKILETEAYLKIIRDFKPFRCFPQLYLRVNPSGDLQFPCMILNEKKINLLEYTEMTHALHDAQESFDIYNFRCDNRCHISCYIEPALSVQRPGVILREARQVLYEKWIRLMVMYHKEKLMVLLNQQRFSDLSGIPGKRSGMTADNRQTAYAEC